MKEIALLGLTIFLLACTTKDKVAYQQVTVVPVHESLSCKTRNTVDMTTTGIDHY